MSNSHSRRNSMRVDYHVWVDTFSCERQVLLSIRNTTCSLLSVTTSKLITNHRDFNSTHFYFHISDFVFVCSQNY